MKRRWHIRTRILVTLIGLTCALLLTVALAFNLSVRSYIRSRVSSQLDSVSESVSEDRQDGGKHGGKRFDEHQDRITGTRGSAVVLNADGSIASILHGGEDAAGELSDYFAGRGLEPVRYRVVSLDSGSYALSVTPDPIQDGAYLVSYADVTSLTAFTNRVNLVLLLIILAAILLSVLLSRRIARSFAEPVQSLSDYAGQIGSGNLEPQSKQFRDVEFNQLAESMDRMVTDLNEANRRQETFFQNVSHELRTPLTSIRGNAEGIVCGLIDPQSGGSVILSESDRLGGMVEDILYLSRMGKARPEDAPEPLDLREVLSLCVCEQHTAAESRGLDFTFDFDETPVLLSVRETDAQHLFGNLISNAIRYASKTIRLDCHSGPNGITVRVADDGPGIDPEDLPHIFERFYRGKGGKHGIGLAVAEAVVRSCGGELTAANDGGAVFEARFPVQSA